MRFMFISVFITTFLLFGVSRAQTKKTEEVPSIPILKDTTQIEERQRFLVETPQDRPIDPESYIIGPGDKLGIAIIGPLNRHMVCPVLPEGKIYLPQLDVIQLEKNETLAHLQDRLKEFLSNNFNNSRFEIFLSHVKTFRVSISGEIEFPGYYEVNGNSRLLDIVRTAGFLETSSARKIQIIKEDTTLICDLLSAIYTDDPSGNPYLNMGDRVFVPAMEPDYDKVEIYGAVNRPGIIEFREGDVLSKVIELALGLWTNADSEQVKIARFISDKNEYEEQIVSLKSKPDFPLKPDDRILVYPRSGFREKSKVEIIGEVKYPGFYPIIDGKTKLSEVIAAAGGFTEQASLFQAQMQRMRWEEIRDPELARLNMMLASDMNDIEREYWKIRNREPKNLVAVDFERLFLRNEKKFDVELRDGDVITIPRITKSVTVSGAVAMPGIRPFKEGADYKYYIELAGGFNDKARKSQIQIIKPQTGTWLKAHSSIPIEEGDIIFIPEKPIRDYWEIFKDSLLILTQAATIIFMVSTIAK